MRSVRAGRLAGGVTRTNSVGPSWPTKSLDPPTSRMALWIIRLTAPLHIIRGHKAIGFAKFAQGFRSKRAMQAQSLLSRHSRRRSSTSSPFCQAGDGLVRELWVGAPQGIAHAQAQFLDVKGLGDVIIRAQFQTLQAVERSRFSVRKIIGISIVRWLVRRRRATSKPSISGRRISRMTRSGWSCGRPGQHLHPS